jgi:hypothetical protein
MLIAIMKKNENRCFDEFIYVVSGSPRKAKPKARQIVGDFNKDGKQRPFGDSYAKEIDTARPCGEELRSVLKSIVYVSITDRVKIPGGVVNPRSDGPKNHVIVDHCPTTGGYLIAVINKKGVAVDLYHIMQRPEYAFDLYQYELDIMTGKAR